MIKHLNVHVAGKVQGVFFRASTQSKARELGVTGFVRNDPDGTVYIEVEGQEENLKKFMAWCAEGPPHAQVDKINVSEAAVENFKTFEIKR